MQNAMGTHLHWLADQSARGYISFAALTLVVWDALLNLGLEVQHIWHGEGTWIKRVYLFSRYFGIFALAANLALVLCLINHSPTSEMCTAWYLFQLVATRLVISSIEIILGLRVYALYNMDRWIGTLLLSTHIGGFFITLFCGTRLILRLEFDHACNATSHSYFDVVFFIMSALLRNGVVWALTSRQRYAANKEGWGESPVMNLVFRDSMWVMVALFAMFSTVIPYMMLVKVAAHAVFLLPLALGSIYVRHYVAPISPTITDAQTVMSPYNDDPGPTAPEPAFPDTSTIDNVIQGRFCLLSKRQGDDVSVVKADDQVTSTYMSQLVPFKATKRH